MYESVKGQQPPPGAGEPGQNPFTGGQPGGQAGTGQQQSGEGGKKVENADFEVVDDK